MADRRTCSANDRQAAFECRTLLARLEWDGAQGLYLSAGTDRPACPGKEYGGIEYGVLPVKYVVFTSRPGDFAAAVRPPQPRSLVEGQCSLLCSIGHLHG